MLRHVLFWSTATGIIMAAGLLPTPSSKRLAELQLPQVRLPDIDLSNISLPTQPELLAELEDLSLNLPEFGKRIEEQVARVIPGLADEAPDLPAPLQQIATAPPEKQTDVVNFDLNATALDAQAKAKLNDFAIWLQANPAAEIGVFGHTDLTGAADYNERLGQQRAEQVVSYLMDTGVPADRISIVMSYGERAPLVATEETSRDNRRVLVETIQVN